MESLETLMADERVTVRRAGPPDAAGACVVYWMQRAQRADDNPALDVAIAAANALGKPPVAYLGLVPFYPNANARHYRFLVDGLPDLAERLRRRGVSLVVRRFPDHDLLRFCTEVRASLVVGDENPLREPERWRRVVAERLRVPLWTVDADVIVPSRLIGKEQFAARTLRPRLRRELGRFLVRRREPSAHRWFKAPPLLQTLDPRGDLLAGWPLDRSVAPAATFAGGTREARRRLRAFVRHRLAGYARTRNRPELDGTSRLSPYLHFGQLGPLEVALAVQAADAPDEDKAAFLEELIVRRELAVNFVRYNAAYDRLDGCEAWAKRTLAAHARDPRPLLVDDARLEAGETPDALWNAAQRQMVDEGYMPGWLRMYWAKRLLLWSETPEQAFERAVRLNDRYELDGRDPNGYAGVAWAIGGKHDRPWPERAVFGKVRYMSEAGAARKVNVRGYIARVAEGEGSRV